MSFGVLVERDGFDGPKVTGTPTTTGVYIPGARSAAKPAIRDCKQIPRYEVGSSSPSMVPFKHENTSPDDFTVSYVPVKSRCKCVRI